jgi:hypothetical protein
VGSTRSSSYRSLCMNVDSGTNGVKKRHFIVK